MSNSPRAAQSARESWLRGNVLTISIVGVMLVSGGVGLAFNRTHAPVEEIAVVPGDPATDLSLPAGAVNEVLPSPTLVGTTRVRMSFEDVTPPQNPFVPTAAARRLLPRERPPRSKCRRPPSLPSALMTSR